MDNLFVMIPMIGGLIIGLVSVIIDAKQRTSEKSEQQTITRILSNNEMPLEEIVRSVLRMQVEQQKKDKWIERIIGFLIGIASSLFVSVALYLIGMS